ncbi:hypothetical protein QEJ31_12975 [Pigmentibacter sp. JX0631]|nr:hypothetical protein [Pigmentibacter sp. JX0631]WGL59437.1 hypothetical protein QEJ31_12975 [Pigmentibacter sp. JX0631]
MEGCTGSDVVLPVSAFTSFLDSSTSKTPFAISPLLPSIKPTVGLGV